MTTSETNFSAEDLEEEDATAVTACLMSWTSRVEGSIRRSLVKVRAMPPVAVRQKGQPRASQPRAVRGKSFIVPIMPQRIVVTFSIYERMLGVSEA